MSWLTGDRADPLRISEAIEHKWWEKLQPNRKGVYRLIALKDMLNLAPMALNRVCGSDGTGTLYIGASNRSLLNRLGNLVATHLDYGAHSHRALSPTLAKRFPADKLAISWEYAEHPWDREAELLTTYEIEFGELPPNNGQGWILQPHR